MERKKLEQKEEFAREALKGSMPDFVTFPQRSGRQFLTYIQYQQGHRAETAKTMSIITSPGVKTFSL